MSINQLFSQQDSSTPLESEFVSIPTQKKSTTKLVFIYEFSRSKPRKMKTNTFIPSLLVEVVSLIYYKGRNEESHILHSSYAAVGSTNPILQTLV